MGIKSTIETGLDDEDRKALDQLITGGKLSLNGLLEWLGEKGYDISRSALHRHVQKVEKMGAKLRQSRAMTEALVKELGPDVTEGKQGRLLVEVLRTMVFDHLSKQMDEGEGTDAPGAQDFFFLAKAMKELSSANKIDLDRELAIRAEAEKKAKAEAATAAEKVAKQAGLTKDTVNDIRAAILGIDSKGV